MQTQPDFETAFLTQLELHSRMFGVKWVVNLCHTFIVKSLDDNHLPLNIEKDSLCEEVPSIVPFVEEENSVILSIPDSPEPEVQILRLKKSVSLESPTHCSPQAKQILTDTVKKSTIVPKKRSPLRDLSKLVKAGLLTAGTKVVPADTELKSDRYGIIQMNSSGKVGIQPSWNPDTLYIGKSNAPTQFLAGVNKQFPSHKVYGRKNAWNDLLKVNPNGTYVSLADLWIQLR